MIDLPWATVALVRDPLVGALLLFSLGGALSHYLFRRHPLGRAMVRVVFLIVLTIVLLYAGVVPYEPLVRTGVPLQDAVRATLKIAWWLWTAWFFVGFLRVFVVAEHRPREGKLVQDLLAGVIYLAARQLDGRMGTPEEIAATIAFIASEGGRFFNGASVVVDGGMTAV